MPDETKYPNKPLQSWVPKSMRDSGVYLDEGCGDIEQAEAGISYDHAMKEIDGPKSRAKDETTFTSESTNHGNNENGPAGLPLMSAAGNKLAKKTAPSSALVVSEQIGTSAVDRAMRGGKR